MTELEKLARMVGLNETILKMVINGEATIDIKIRLSKKTIQTEDIVEDEELVEKPKVHKVEEVEPVEIMVAEERRVISTEDIKDSTKNKPEPVEVVVDQPQPTVPKFKNNVTLSPDKEVLDSDTIKAAFEFSDAMEKIANDDDAPAEVGELWRNAALDNDPTMGWNIENKAPATNIPEPGVWTPAQDPFGSSTGTNTNKGSEDDMPSAWTNWMSDIPKININNK